MFYDIFLDVLKNPLTFSSHVLKNPLTFVKDPVKILSSLKKKSSPYQNLLTLQC